MTLRDETIDDTKPYEIFHPVHTWKRMTLTNFFSRPLQIPIYQNGKCVYSLPDLNSRRDYCQSEINSLWEEYKRFENPHVYKVDLSQKVWDLKDRLLHEANRKGKNANSDQ
ncbi:MAG: hypothetical protein PUK05_03605 [Peptoniphilaceae bacterium]|nr:hypothetical protein [Peptoniphilaceae bacterium]